MTGFVHAALGAALGKAIKDPFVAFGAGVGSHVLGDVVPHHDMDIGEVPLVFGTLIYLAYEHGWKSPEFWGALGAVSPDFEHIPYELKKDPRRFGAMKEKFVPTHNGELEHGTWPYPAKYGVMLNFAFFIGGLLLAGTLAKRSCEVD